MKNKHYVILPTFRETKNNTPSFKVVCLMHDVSTDLKLVEAQALADSLNLRSCREQE